jgi:hypothetical protein
VETCIAAFYQQAAASLKGPSSMMFIFPSIRYTALSNQIFNTLDRVSGGIPLFGILSINVRNELNTPSSIFNGETYQDRIPLLLIGGIKKFKFFQTFLPEQTRFHQKAMVTAAADNRIIELDNEPAVNYLKKLGLAEEDDLNVLYAFPAEINFHNEKPPRMFAVYNTNSDGSITCGIPVPVGATVRIGFLDSKLVLETAVSIVDQIKHELSTNKGYCGLLIFDCFNRNMALADPLEEMLVVQKQLQDFPLPYLFLYAGGEFCPGYTENGRIVNAFHQYTVIACLFG